MFCVRFEGLPEDLACSKDELLLVLRLSAFYEPADRQRSVAQLFARILHIQQTLRGTRVGAVPYLAGHLDRMGRVEAAVAASDALPPPLLNVARCVCYAGKTDQFYCDYCDDTRRHDAREAARDLEARFVMATNTEMSMEPETPAHFEHLVDRAITVTDEETRELQERYLKRLAVTTCLSSCGACGARDPKLCYERWRVEDLPPCFRIHPAVEPASSDRLTGAAWFRVYRKLQSSSVLTVDGRKAMDLSPVLSFYRARSGQYYHLHPELVDEREVTLLCDQCLDKVCSVGGCHTPPCSRRMHTPLAGSHLPCHEQACVEDNVDDPPPLSLANGIDFGVLSRLPGYRAPSEVECMAMSDIRLYHLTVKVCVPWPVHVDPLLPHHAYRARGAGHKQADGAGAGGRTEGQPGHVHSRGAACHTHGFLQTRGAH